MPYAVILTIINDNGISLEYLNSFKCDKNEAARKTFDTNPDKIGIFV
jgi:hypothetical protein